MPRQCQQIHRQVSVHAMLEFSAMLAMPMVDPEWLIRLVDIDHSAIASVQMPLDSEMKPSCGTLISILNNSLEFLLQRRNEL